MKKRLLVFLLSLSLCLSLGVSVNAASTQNSFDGKDFSDAYISFSEQLAEKGVSAQTCLEDFISGYESFGGSIEQYTSTLVEYETRQAPSLNTTVRRNLQIASEYFASHSEAPSAEYSTRSTRGQWYDNIGETNPKLPQAADYSSYNILTKVKKGDIIGYIEAMKTYNAIRADRDGVITAILVNSGDSVEEDDVIMKIQ